VIVNINIVPEEHLDSSDPKLPYAAIGIRGVAGVLPPVSHTLAELDAKSLIRSTPETLAGFGFERAFIATAEFDAGAMALHAARQALNDAQLDARQIDVLIWASAMPHGHLRNTSGASDDVLRHFQYAGGWLQEEMGLINADVMGVCQQGCATMFSALRMARSLMIAELNIRHVLCVSVDVLPPGSTREIMYNLISDAACAVVVSRDATADRWIGHHQISRGYYWDPIARQAEIIAAYFPTSRAVIEQLLQRQGLTPADIDLVVPTGVNRSSWDILLRLVGIPKSKMYQTQNPFGHTVSSDAFLLLQEIRRSGKVANGSKLLLFSYGFGSTWSTLLLEH
jgi:3-oxoacyl-[acyl-carrier-protein] synthase-3